MHGEKGGRESSDRAERIRRNGEITKKEGPKRSDKREIKLYILGCEKSLR